MDVMENFSDVRVKPFACDGHFPAHGLIVFDLLIFDDLIHTVFFLFPGRWHNCRAILRCPGCRRLGSFRCIRFPLPSQLLFALAVVALSYEVTPSCTLCCPPTIAVVLKLDLASSHEDGPRPRRKEIHEYWTLGSDGFTAFLSSQKVEDYSAEPWVNQFIWHG